MNIKELAEKAGFNPVDFFDPNCDCDECNWLRKPLTEFANLVLEEAAKKCDEQKVTNKRWLEDYSLGYAECAEELADTIREMQE